MKISYKEMRKALNKAWRAGMIYRDIFWRDRPGQFSRRYQDVTKILREIFPDPPKEEKKSEI